jgi:DNA-binding HxlR family transcriptional regulator
VVHVLGYPLTESGRTLLVAVTPLVEWATVHLAEIDRARGAYDALAGARQHGRS